MISPVNPLLFQTGPAAAQRVVFAPGTQGRGAAAVTAPGRTRDVVVTHVDQATAGQGKFAGLGRFAAGPFARATTHPQVEVTDRVLTSVHGKWLATIGGGSTIDPCKAMALPTALPQVFIPATFDGSKAKPWVRPVAGPDDVAQVRALPRQRVVASGKTPVAVVVAGPYARDRNPISARMALERMRALAVNFRRLAGGAPTNPTALGPAEVDLPRAVGLVAANLYWNPRPVERDALTALLAHAFVGDRAQP